MTKDGIREMVSRSLKRVYGKVVEEPITEDFKWLLEKLK
jgi:hypothetical protein